MKKNAKKVKTLTKAANKRNNSEKCEKTRKIQNLNKGAKNKQKCEENAKM